MLSAICFAIICAKGPTDTKKNPQIQKLVLEKIAALEKKAAKEADAKKKEDLKKRCAALAKRITE